ncbi:MAG: histidine kinase dimerization/phospho-acceptor domain-containing protein, partial [Opitutus sp.]
MRRWWQHRSLRFRLAAWYALGGTILLTAFSATVYFFVAYNMGQPLDHTLQVDLASVRQQLRVESDGRVLWRNKEVAAGAAWSAKNPWFEIWNAEGQLIRRFWPFDDDRLERLPTAPAPGRETISVFNVSPDVRLRVLSVPFAVSNDNHAWMLRVMTIHEPAVNALGALILIIAIALPVVVAILVLGGYALTRQWLKPLDQMVREANEISASHLSQRLTVSNPRDELGRLTIVFNTTLTRVEDSFLTLERFVADAAHELLTPLATLRSVGEVALRSNSIKDYRDVVGSMLEEAQRLQLLVEKLLQLARAEGGANMLERTSVRLDRLAQQCVEDATILAEEKNQRILAEVVEAEADTDALLLRQAVQNLLDNAMKY